MKVMEAKKPPSDLFEIEIDGKKHTFPKKEYSDWPKLVEMYRVSKTQSQVRREDAAKRKKIKRIQKSYEKEDQETLKEMFENKGDVEASLGWGMTTHKGPAEKILPNIPSPEREIWILRRFGTDYNAISEFTKKNLSVSAVRQRFSRMGGDALDIERIISDENKIQSPTGERLTFSIPPSDRQSRREPAARKLSDDDEDPIGNCHISGESDDSSNELDGKEIG